MATCRSASYKVEHSLEHFEQDEQRNSLSGKPQTCPRVKRFIRESPAHIGEALTGSSGRSAGNTEGSPRDPVTTASHAIWCASGGALHSSRVKSTNATRRRRLSDQMKG